MVTQHSAHCADGILDLQLLTDMTAPKETAIRVAADHSLYIAKAMTRIAVTYSKWSWLLEVVEISRLLQQTIHCKRLKPQRESQLLRDRFGCA